jgi:2'-5' RNA ligase
MHIYDQLWQEAVTALGQGQPKLDPFLPGKADDHRRGVSLMFRPSEAVVSRIKAFLDPLAAQFPGQYFYPPEDLHVTVVTLISASELWENEFVDVPAFRGIVREVLGRHSAFDVEFRGITAAPNAVMIQGFARGDTLENVRRDLRREFIERGFPNRLDRRYPNQAAHITALRFCNRDADWKQLLARLAANRQTHFGETHVETLQLVLSDWYASAKDRRLLEEFHLTL